MDQRQEIIYDMNAIRCLSEKGIILTDESLREVGKQGSEAGMKLREIAGV